MDIALRCICVYDSDVSRVSIDISVIINGKTAVGGQAGRQAGKTDRARVRKLPGCAHRARRRARALSTLIVIIIIITIMRLIIVVVIITIMIIMIILIAEPG